MNLHPHIIGIDPGGEHVGWAHFTDGRGVVVCERTPQGAENVLDDTIAELQRRGEGEDLLVIIEEFRLYPDKARSLIGSDMATSQLIGSLRYIARRSGVPVILQPAGIKLPTEAQMRRRGITHRAVLEKQGGHAKDAETHVWHHLLRNNLV